jgi:predicted NBD/HSP70 family sugar kinase
MTEVKSEHITHMKTIPAIPVEAQFLPPLELEFKPAALYNRVFLQELSLSGKGMPLVFALERADGSVSRFETQVFRAEHPWAIHNAYYCERILKFLLWQHGGWRVFVGGPVEIGDYLRQCYSPDGARSFDYHILGENIYQKRFTVVTCKPEQTPAENESEQSLGRHLDGCRIGFDLGASDIKVSAVIEGETVFSKEIEWNPSEQNDLAYHHEKIIKALLLAREKLPRLDAIGGSSAGVIVNNRPMVASLFRGIPKERYALVHNLFLDIQKELGVPLEIVNDGEVSALAGSMSLGKNAVLGVAFGSSLAAGYVTPKGNITNWLNELAFAPIDYNPAATADEWSRDNGVGALYMSQQCVFRLAPQVGIAIPAGLTPAQKLKFVQEKLEAGDDGARQIWESIGVFLGYAVAHYASFYTLENMLILGRVTSGKGGEIILKAACRVLEAEFPDQARRIDIQLPDELSRRLGQSVAAASLPEIRS